MDIHILICTNVCLSSLMLSFFLLAIFSSLEPKAQCWAYRIGKPLPSVCVYVCVLYVNIFKHLLLWNHWADWSQISYGASLGRGNESLFKWSRSHMTKMAAMPIYGKNLKKSSPEPNDRWPWNLVRSIGCSSTSKFVQMMTLGWPWPILRQGQIWFLLLLYWVKVKQWIFQKLL